MLERAPLITGIATADGALNAPERAFITEVARIFGISSADHAARGP